VGDEEIIGVANPSALWVIKTSPRMESRSFEQAVASGIA
jgi:hypothetical protein